MRDAQTQIIHAFLMEITLLWFEVQVVLLQDAEELFDHHSMLLHGFSENEDVVNVDDDHTFCDEFTEEVIHHCLKGGR